MKHIILLTALVAGLISCQKPGDNPDNTDNTYKPLQLSTRSAEFVTEGMPFAFEFIDRVQALGCALGIEPGYLLVLDGKVILLDGERSFCGFYNHKAALYSPNICTSSNRGRTACRAWR